MLLFKYEFKNFISFIEILPLDALLGPLDTSVEKKQQRLGGIFHVVMEDTEKIKNDMWILCKFVE